MAIVSGPGQSQGLLYKHLRHSFSQSVILFLPQLYGAAMPKWLEICHSTQELSKSRMASKSNQWFKSYDHFTEGMNFAY